VPAMRRATVWPSSEPLLCVRREDRGLPSNLPHFIAPPGTHPVIKPLISLLRGYLGHRGGRNKFWKAVESAGADVRPPATHSRHISLRRILSGMSPASSTSRAVSPIRPLVACGVTPQGGAGEPRAIDRYRRSGPPAESRSRSARESCDS
jgi:hypothetical protein